jgi:23S rRNA pseudouridine1911/1915/1917 synthase
MSIDILLETSDFLIINKPAGLRVHADGKSDVPTVVDWVLSTHPDIAGVCDPMLMVVDGKTIHRPGIVHRLDEDTSGALVIAKTQEAFDYLKQQFKDRLVQKEYHAFVWGHFKEPSVVVDQPIGRSSGDFRRWQAGRGVRGETREAVTRIDAVAQFEELVNGKSERFSFIHAFPKTGRTHQIRVHLKYLQRPIVCDPLYAESAPAALGFTRLALHARTISFTAPGGGLVQITAPYPVDFEAALAKYSK